VHDLFAHWRKAAVLLALTLSACGGGGSDSNNGSNPGSGTEVSTDSLSFKADSPSAATPAGEVVSITFGTNIAHLAITHRGLAIGTVTSTFSGRTAQITITPDAPSSTGAGLFEGAVAVTGYLCADANCSAFAAGDTRTISVKYQVSPGVLYVAPYVAMSQTASAGVVRGFGFKAFNVANVQFGDTNATAFAVTNDTQIFVQMPALPAGTYPVTVDIPTHDGPIPSQATLIVVDPIAYSAQTLAYPAAVTQVNAVLYDAERRSILVATDASGSQLARYAYDGSNWIPQSSGAITQLRDIALSINGKQLYALSDSQVTLVDPATLTAGKALTASDLPDGAYFKSIAVSNSNTAYITTAIAVADAQTPLYAFSESANTLVALSSPLLNYASAVSNSAGSSVTFVQGDATSTAALPVYQQTGSGITQSAVNLQQTAAETAVDRVAARVVLGGSLVFEGTLTDSASIPVADAVAVNPDGTRAYAYYASPNTIETFDISTINNGATLTSLGTTTLTANPGATVKMTITPDAKTLILAGAAQIVIQPTPTF
jgi:hypothetical protein